MKVNVALGFGLCTLALLAGCSSIDSAEKEFASTTVEVNDSPLRGNALTETVPFIPLEANFLEEVKPMSLSSVDSNLGMGYQAFSFPFASATNTTFRVIDIDALSNDAKLKDIIAVKNIYESSSSFFTFCSFNEYVEKISTKFNRNRSFSSNFRNIVKTEFENDFLNNLTIIAL